MWMTAAVPNLDWSARPGYGLAKTGNDCSGVPLGVLLHGVDVHRAGVFHGFTAEQDSTRMGLPPR